MFPVVLCTVTLASASLSDQATDYGSSDDWEYSASIYLWGTGLLGITRTRSAVPDLKTEL